VIGYSFHPEARAEAREATRYYRSFSSELAQDFRNALKDALSFIRRLPEAPPFYPGTSLRRKLVAGFPYSLIYAKESGRLVVYAVANQRRPPGYWLSRATRQP
jgi:plasmid stabilization system protein ParE